MGEGIGKAMFILNILAVVGMLSILGGLGYGLFKLVMWIF